MNEKIQNINILLDKLRDFPKNFILAKTVEQAIYYLENYHVKIILLDHDLGEDRNLISTGYGLNKIYLWE
ncbi:cyclic-phosphate processing receiver domain-containing protein [Clostridium ljungdahlii]|uniref:Cyclic-phosphate processing Receiver domain-containing protein n=1 Tax=Clostridium ljungdahlii TaxID=1538 RepID=A0A162KNI0_9CLOT|nr:cyclic-phosphate processing receiver domain-containing protein [Clostridium ljungdahlii]OAA84702.1 hypothetical protein WY13_02601 [Clostridium ljungdahlii]